VLKALALGAHSTWIGRAWLHGLGAMGEAGVTKALEIIRKELDISMALCGERNVKDIGPQNVMIPQGFLDEYDVQAPMRASRIAPVAV
jgi:L-lactate dehydrogenase (cytochrome)